MSFFNMFGSSSSDNRTPYEIARDQSRAISREIRQEKLDLDRHIRACDRDIQRLTKDIQKQARTNNKAALCILAKGIVKNRNNINRLQLAKANLDLLDNEVKNQLVNVRLAGAMQKSAEVARLMSELIKVEQFQAVAEQFSAGLLKMGILEDMINEQLDAGLDGNDVEEETDKEVDKVLNEILFGKMKELPVVPVPTPSTQPVKSDVELEAMEKRLELLKG